MATLATSQEISPSAFIYSKTTSSSTSSSYDTMTPKALGMVLHAWLSEVNPTLPKLLIIVTIDVFTARARDYLEKVYTPHHEKPLDMANFEKIIDNTIRCAKELR